MRADLQHGIVRRKKKNLVQVWTFQMLSSGKTVSAEYYQPALNRSMDEKNSKSLDQILRELTQPIASGSMKNENLPNAV